MCREVGEKVWPAFFFFFFFCSRWLLAEYIQLWEMDKEMSIGDGLPSSCLKKKRIHHDFLSWIIS